MAKTLILTLGLLGIAGAAFAYKDDVSRWIPPEVVGKIKDTTGIDVASVMATWQQSQAPAGPSAGSADKSAAKSGNAKSGDAKSGDVKSEAGGAKSEAAGAKRGPPAAPVTTALVEFKDMPVVLSAPGTVEPTATVAIKPRVDGQVIEVGFAEGDFVKAGAVLYRLDDRLVKAQIRQAEAQINRDEASLKDALSILDRKESLLQKKYASEATTETARQQVEVLRANIDAGGAMLEMQRTQLDYLNIRAPISGRTGSNAAKLGTFVRSADPTPLVTINQTMPIAVSFALPQANLKALKDALATNSTATILVPGATRVEVSGRLFFVDNQVDKTTGAVTAKVMADNAGESLWPGQAVSVDLIVELRRNVASVPASAVLPAQQGMIAWIVGTDNKVSIREVKVERVIGQTTFVSAGLQSGERVVTDGQLRLAPGAPVLVRDGGRPAGAPAPGGSATPTGPAAAAGKAPATAPPAAAPPATGAAPSKAGPGAAEIETKPTTSGGRS